MSDQEQYVKYIKIPVNNGCSYYMLTADYFATCTITQFKMMLKLIRYSKYLLSEEDVNKVFNFIQQGVTEQLNFLNSYSGYVAKKKGLNKKLEILSEERGLYYDV